MISYEVGQGIRQLDAAILSLVGARGTAEGKNILEWEKPLRLEIGRLNGIRCRLEDLLAKMVGREVSDADAVAREVFCATGVPNRRG